MIKPRINKKKRLVCVYNSALEMFSVYKIKKNGTINNRVAPEYAYTNDVQEAFKNMNYPFAGFKTVSNSKSIKAKDWVEYVESVWELGNK